MLALRHSCLAATYTYDYRLDATSAEHTARMANRRSDRRASILIVGKFKTTSRAFEARVYIQCLVVAFSFCSSLIV